MSGFISLHLSYQYDQEKYLYDFNFYGISTQMMPHLIKHLKEEMQKRHSAVDFRQELAESGAVPVVKDNQLILEYFDNKR